MIDRRSTDPVRAPGLRAVLALTAGLAVGVCVLFALALSGRAARADLGGMCAAASPLVAVAAPGRACERLALNLVTLPYLTGVALLVPRLPGRLAVRIAHAAAAAAPAAVLAALVLADPTLLPDAGVLLVTLVLGGLLLTGALHGVRPPHLRRRLPRAANAVHLALAAVWLVVVVGSDLVAALSLHG